LVAVVEVAQAAIYTLGLDVPVLVFDLLDNASPVIATIIRVDIPFDDSSF
jgi:hypothetical protein